MAHLHPITPGPLLTLALRHDIKFGDGCGGRCQLQNIDKILDNASWETRIPSEGLEGDLESCQVEGGSRRVGQCQEQDVEDLGAHATVAKERVDPVVPTQDRVP